MSSEVAKKRGRPKKVISDPVEVEIPASSKKSTTRAKSTKATPKAVKAASIAPTKAAPVNESVSSTVVPSVSPQNTSSSPKSPAKSPPSRPSTNIPQPPTKTPVTPETSKILGKVRELSPKNGHTTEGASAKVTKPTPTPSASKQTPPPPQPKSTPLTSTTTATSSVKSTAKSIPSSQTPTTSKLTPTQPPKPVSKPHIPVASINSEIVSNIATRAGAKPNVSPNKPLSKSYKSAARRVTMTIVALPIAIVTSYVLYERLVLGEERKVLVRPGLSKVESPAGIEASAEGAAGQS